MLDLLTSIEAAEELRISPATLDSWRSRGTGPTYIKVGGRPLYRRSDLVIYSLKCEVKTKERKGDNNETI